MGVAAFDFARKHPRGRPRNAGQFREKTTRAPVTALEAKAAPATRSDELHAGYSALWQRLNANHRQSVYGDAERLSQVSTDPAELAILSHLAFGATAMNVARNPATPPEVLHKMAVGVSEHERDDVRREAVLHPNCDPETIRIVWEHRHSKLPQGRAADVVAQAPNTPDDLRQEALASLVAA